MRADNITYHPHNAARVKDGHSWKNLGDVGLTRISLAFPWLIRDHW